MENFETKRQSEEAYIEIENQYRNKKYDTVIRLATIYLSKYSNNKKIRYLRAKSYRNIGEFDKAIKDLNDNLPNKQSLTELFFLYYYLKMYKECYELLPNIENKYPSNNLIMMELVIKKNLGIPIIKSNYENCGYRISQIINYDEKNAIKYIVNNENGEKSETRFNSELNFDYLYNRLKENIQIGNEINALEALSTYYFGIGNVGYENNNICNFIKVVVIPNTNQIINIHPTVDVNINYISCIDLDYNKLFNREKSKVKVMSQIDKFNNRYNKNKI